MRYGLYFVARSTALGVLLALAGLTGGNWQFWALLAVANLPVNLD